MSKIITWLKIGNNFINQDNIRGLSRLGKKTRIERINGEDIVVDMDYDKVRSALPNIHK